MKPITLSLFKLSAESSNDWWSQGWIPESDLVIYLYNIVVRSEWNESVDLLCCMCMQACMYMLENASGHSFIHLDEET